MLDYLGYLWAQERMREQMGERSRTPSFDGVVSARRPSGTKWRQRAARALRATADRLEPRPSS